MPGMYEPGGVILSLHEQKNKYQRNMLFGLGMCVMLSLGFGLWVRSLDGSTPRSASPTVVPNLVTPDRDLVEPSEKPAMVAVGGINPYAIAHDGFLGFVNLRPVCQAPELIAERPDVYDPDLAPLGIDSTPSFSTVEGDEEGLFLPEEYTIADAYLPPENVRPPVTRQVQVVYKPDPEYPFVARDAGKEGNITVLVYIDSAGELTTFPDWIGGEEIQTFEYMVGSARRIVNYAVKEEPPGWFFAKNFLKVLPEWVFAPSIRNGKPVSSLLRIKYNFCLGSNCLRYELEQLGS